MKSNFIILENFILQNPQLTDAERAEILRLDADLGRQAPVDASEPEGLTASMVAEVGCHIFDETEIRAFLESNHIGYEDLADPSETNAASVDWHFDLARYIEPSTCNHGISNSLGQLHAEPRPNGTRVELQSYTKMPPISGPESIYFWQILLVTLKKGPLFL